ncbi:hypothetical protein, partial [uncultured Clostridium sp.]|uniref:hypothetical protein n=1 Tax=uncultured Clostridium sp. TaxID=59620 RepID=UPI0025CC1109
LLKDDKIKEFYEKFDFNFSDFRPDLIKVLEKSENIKVLDKNLNTIKCSNNKIKLQLCDIKMSDFSNTYYLELGLYMMVLNKFIYENDLDDKYEVAATAIIYPQKNNESEVERESRIKDKSYSIEEWVAEFSSLKSSLEDIFMQELPEIIKIIEQGNTDEYLNVKITSRCQTCDYYGGQYSEFLRQRIQIENKKRKSEDPNYIEQDINQYLKDPRNHFCRYYMKEIENINILPALKNGEKNILLDKGINSLDKLNKEIELNTSGVFNSNVTLKADKIRLGEEVKLRKDKTNNFIYTTNNSLNMPLYSNLNIFIDIKKDTQGRTISLAFLYTFYAKDFSGNVIKDSSKGNEYIDIISDYSSENEKKATLDFLIKLNNVLSQFEKIKLLYGHAPTFAIIYWGEEVIEHLKELFIKVMKYITSSGEGIEEIYTDLESDEEILEKKKDIKKVLYRFNVFFTDDDELKDYRVVETSPFFNMKKCIEEVMVIDLNYNYTLTEVYNKMFNKDYGNYYCKPDSD